MSFIYAPAVLLATTVLVAYLVYWLVKPLLATWRNPVPTSYERVFVDPAQSTVGHVHKVAFPSLLESSSIYLSVIVPAYEEALRLPHMMQETLAYLTEREQRDKAFTWEIIIADDGSKDTTAEVGHRYSRDYGTDRIRVLRLKINQGKGGAVQQGMLAGRGQYLLFVDADGATKISDFEKLEVALKVVEKNGFGIAVGSRAHLEEKAVATRKIHRNIAMWGFHFIVSTLCVRGVRDTQCGFKLFSRQAAQHLFVNQHLRRWAFDVELLYLARCLDIPITEVAVTWAEIPGSKLSVLSASLQMARDLVIIRLAYMLGIWSIHHPRAFKEHVA